MPTPAKSPGHWRIRITVGLLALVTFAGALLSLHRPPTPGSGTLPPGNPDAHRAIHELVVYTNPGTTTPQLPLWCAVREGTLQGRVQLQTRLWKTAAHLQSVLLAGEGDLWVGHVDGFARARERGAPVVLLAVTGWRKFALLSCDDSVQGFADFAGHSLPYAPMGCPSVDILRAVMGEPGGTIDFEPHEPKQLALKMLKGSARAALLPEPLVTTLLEKIPSLRVVANVEDEYARINGGLPRMPIAGIAVHQRLADADPALLQSLLAAMQEAAEALRRDPALVTRVLPAEFAEFVPPETVVASLSRDVIHVEPAQAVAGEVEKYLRIVTPEIFAEGQGLDPGLLFAPATEKRER
ncbi:MAG: hypothetical protein JXR77_12765 [Lentisphaeria bacterium]|nr:hypothetical protein [Lentisphaeria bacterium]